ncbi:MAG: hypothetical protein MJE77_29315 [Proteobacteria bacterium]|nr:hypothetical protein [Pseudomonadota bacterium]
MSEEKVVREKGVEVIAKSLYRELARQGYDMRHVVAVATALLDAAISAHAEAR